MRDDRPALISPSPADLPLLFEAGRLLVRHASLEEAMSPLLALLADRADLAGGIAALALSDDGDVRVTAVSDASDAALAGKRVELGNGVLGKAIAAASPTFENGSLAVPVVFGGNAVGALSFSRLYGGRDRALSLASSVAALVAEAYGLRRRLARAALGDLGGSHAVPQTAEPLCADEGWAPAAIIGRSAPMRELYSLMDRVAGTETTVLISGESGTGKELVARALHERSGRAKAAFIAVNCAALPESVIESELFGHERGAFTGAQELRRGRFELADRGTLFLDEIGELSPAVQAKLLRAVQEGEFQRVGGSVTLKTNVRVIAATNRDLEREVAESRFRADLFWRLNVFPIRVPPLRERRSDIVLLADYFAEKHSRRSGKPILRISSPAIDLLMTYHWPGNVRELENCVERAVILSTDSVIHAYHLPPSLQSADSTGTGPASTLDASLARLERELLVEALKICRGNAAAAARRLGVTERRMGLALHRFGIDWRRFRTSV
ncbi:MAG: sigma 54-interacting transcriptional regulator [Rectinemataceae bacterium]|jgi:Nif-specific regulatory protein